MIILYVRSLNLTYLPLDMTLPIYGHGHISPKTIEPDISAIASSFHTFCAGSSTGYSIATNSSVILNIGLSLVIFLFSWAEPKLDSPSSCSFPFSTLLDYHCVFQPHSGFVETTFAFGYFFLGCPQVSTPTKETGQLLLMNLLSNQFSSDLDTSGLGTT